MVLPAQLPEIIRVIETTEDSRPLQQTINQSSSNLNNASMGSVIRPMTAVALLSASSDGPSRTSAPAPSSGGAGEGGATQGPAGQSSDSGTGEGSGRGAGSEKKDDKKDDKKKDVVAQKEEKKDEAPKKKQYCN